MLASLVRELQQALGILHKRDIQEISQKLGSWVKSRTTQEPIFLGDDCGAIADGDSYLLLASEGMSPELVETDPWFAGWCGVLVNVSDIYAMGGEPIAVVDALWSRNTDHAQLLLAGMMQASEVFGVPIVGGHTNTHSSYNALSVAILGRARHLITSFDAEVGDALVLVTNLQGQPRPHFPLCWDAATGAEPSLLRSQLQLLPQIAQARLCKAGKDISMGGIIGTTLMLLETSQCGSILDLNAIPCPANLSLKQWLLSFPSYGFLLSINPLNLGQVQDLFNQHNLTCATIGQVIGDRHLILQYGSESQIFWSLEQVSLTGFRQNIL